VGRGVRIKILRHWFRGSELYGHFCAAKCSRYQMSEIPKAMWNKVSSCECGLDCGHWKTELFICLRIRITKYCVALNVTDNRTLFVLAHYNHTI